MLNSSLLLYKCNFATVENCNVNIWYQDMWYYLPGWEPLSYMIMTQEVHSLLWYFQGYMGLCVRLQKFFLVMKKKIKLEMPYLDYIGFLSESHWSSRKRLNAVFSICDSHSTPLLCSTPKYFQNAINFTSNLLISKWTYCLRSSYIILTFSSQTPDPAELPRIFSYLSLLLTTCCYLPLKS